jgi:hypothetical protein
MNGRISGAIEIVVFGLAVTALFALVAVLAKLIFKKSIGTPKYYSTGMMAGALIYVATLSLLQKPVRADAGSAVSVVPQTGLDAPFIAPSKDNIESFIPQLGNAMMKLAPGDKAQLGDAVEFLTYASADYIKQNEPERFAKWGQSDIAAHSFVKLHNYAIEQGNAMTLRKYVVLAAEFKRQTPELYQQFIVANKQP